MKIGDVLSVLCSFMTLWLRRNCSLCLDHPCPPSSSGYFLPFHQDSLSSLTPGSVCNRLLSAPTPWCSLPPWMANVGLPISLSPPRWRPCVMTLCVATVWHSTWHTGDNKQIHEHIFSKLKEKNNFKDKFKPQFCQSHFPATHRPLLSLRLLGVLADVWGFH